MAELNRREIAAITGLPTSTLTRQLSRFPLARSGRGRFSTADSAFAAWLAGYERGDEAEDLTAAYEPPERVGPDPAKLPSGILLPPSALDYLRRGPEQRALALLDRMISLWSLAPHPAIPDRLRREPLKLPSGTVVNAKHWRVLRGTNERRAGYALDVLLRSYGVRA